MASALSACGQAPPRPALPGSASIGSEAALSDAGAALLEAVAPLGSFPDAGALGAHADAGAPATTVGGALDAGAREGSSRDAAPEVTPVGEACPSGMILVDTMYCPKIDRKCLDEEYSPQNRITICHKFAETQRCLAPEEHKRFCIDEYEYPNHKGAHPPWMVSWYDGQATCAVHDKRLCYESEWVAACEGPAKTPFPYGYSRDNTKCNVDNVWLEPHLADLYGKDSQAAAREAGRLDQSVPSGARAECVSGFGVHDLTGNFDEWVTADQAHDDKSQWAGLKGGAWGHVRNACRPVTTSHPPDFTYYFIAFRCCKDVAGGPATRVPATVPEVLPKDRAPLPTPENPPGPSEKKVPREHWGKMPPAPSHS